MGRTLLALAALCSGFGGLLAEVVLARRIGLVTGNTARATAIVFGVFLAALGVGGWLVPALARARRRPFRTASLLYAAVALTLIPALLLTELCAALDRPAVFESDAVAWVAMGAAVGLPAVAMGGAFALLFARAATVAGTGTLNAANLLGSVAAVYFGGNFLIPDLGYRASQALAAGAYALAALLTAGAGRALRTGAEPDAPPAVGAHSGPAAGQDRRLTVLAAVLLLGAATLGFEVILLRRLVFFFEGFAPTLAAVLAAFLLALSLGSAAAAPVFARLAGRGALPLAAGLAALCIALTPLLIQALGPHPNRFLLRRPGVSNELALHLSLLGQTFVIVLLPCLALGATVPLAMRALPGDRSRVAGGVFLWLNLGSACGALATNHLFLPVLSHDPYGAGFAPLAALAAVAAVCASAAARRGEVAAPTSRGRRVLATLALAALTLAPLLLVARRPPLVGSRYFSAERAAVQPVVAHATDDTCTASVVVDPLEHQKLLYTDGFQAASTGRHSAYMWTLGVLPFLLRPRLADCAVIAVGTGTTAAAVLAMGPERTVDLVEVSRAVLEVEPEFAAETGGLRALRADRRVRLHVEDGRRFLLAAARGSLDLVTMEPLLPYAPGTVPLYTREFYVLVLDRLRREGIFVQWIPCHAMPAGFFQTLVATFGAVFPHGSLWLFQNSALLVGSAVPHLPPGVRAAAELAPAIPSPAATRAMLRAGCVADDDLGVAFVTSDLRALAGSAPLLEDDRPFLERLGFWSGPQRDGFLLENLTVLASALDAGGRAASGPEPWPHTASARAARLYARSLAAAPRETRSLLAAEAVERLDAACRLLPGSALLFRERAELRHALLAERGWSLLAARQAPEAEASFVAAIRDRPDLPGSWLGLALARGTGPLAALALAHARDLHPGLAADSRTAARWRAALPLVERVPALAEVLRSAPSEPAGPPDPFAMARLLAATDITGRWPPAAAVHPLEVACAAAAVLEGTADPDVAALAIADRCDPWLLARVTAWCGRVPLPARAAFLARASRWIPEELPVPEPILAAATGGDRAVRLSLAREGLLGRRDAASVETLLALFEKDEDLEVRAASALSLFRIADRPLDPEAPAALRTSLAARFRESLK